MRIPASARATRPASPAFLQFVLVACVGSTSVAAAQHADSRNLAARRAPAARYALAAAPVARRALAVPGLHWVHRVTPGADVYVLAGTAAELLLPTLAGASEHAIRDDLAWLRAPTFGARLRLFFVGAREQMRPFTGATPGGWSVVDEGTSFFVANDSVRPPLRHEIMHQLSWRLWGTPGGSWLSEGIATVAAGACRGYAFDDLAAALDREGRLVPFETLRHDFTAAGDAGLVHYLESASVVTHIDRMYGRARLRALWASGGLSGTARSLGVDAGTLERGWRAAVARRTPSTSWAAMRAGIVAHGCE